MKLEFGNPEHIKMRDHAAENHPDNMGEYLVNVHGTFEGEIKIKAKSPEDAEEIAMQDFFGYIEKDQLELDDFEAECRKTIKKSKFE